MPSSNKPTRSTRSTRSTSQASSAINEEVNVTPKKVTRKRGAAKTVPSSARSTHQTPKPSSVARRGSSSTPRGLVHSPATLRRIGGGSIPEESLSQTYQSMDESIEESGIREPAEVALGEMLNDIEGSSLTEPQKTAYDRFKHARNASLGKSDFISTKTLPDRYASAFSVPTSPFSSLIKLANLTSFLHLVLSSAPDPRNKKRTGASAENLKKASLELMKTVVPETNQVDERILRLVVDLKCQAYLATSHSSSVTARDFFTEPFRSHLPESHKLSTDLRSKFKNMANEASDLIENSANDRAALETRWKWNEFVTDCKQWARERATGSNRRIEEEDEGEKTEASEGTPERRLSKEISVEAHSDEEDEEEEIAQGQPQSDVGEEGADYVAMEEDQEQTSESDAGKETSAEDEEREREQDELEGEESNRSQATSRPAPKSSRSPSPQGEETSDDSIDLADLNPHATGNSSEEDRDLDSLVLDPGFAHEQDDHEKAESQSSQIALDESGSPHSKATSDDDDGLVNIAAVSSAEDRRRSATEEEIKPRLRIGPKSILAKVRSVPSKNSFNKRQSDAVKIPFDSQPQDEATTSSRDHEKPQVEIDSTTEVARVRRKKGKKPISKHFSPPTVERSRDGTPFSENAQEQLKLPVSRSNKRSTVSPIDQTAQSVAEETRYFEHEFGGGFDDDDFQQTGGVDSIGRPSPSHPSLRTTGTAQQSFTGFGSGFGSNFGVLRSGVQASTSAKQPRASTSTNQPRSLPSSSKVPAKKIPRREPEPALDDSFDSVSEDDQGQEEEDQAEQEDERFLGRSEAFKSRKGKEKAIEGRSSARPGTSDPFERRKPIIPKRRREEEETREAKRRAKEVKKQRREREEMESTNEESERRGMEREEEEEEAGMPFIQGRGNLYHQNRNQSGARIEWTPEETERLHKCLRKYGTDWRRMMKEHGPGGAISSTFANRNNVSLKDKAVNIAKNIIKSGQPMPGHLKDIHVPKGKLQAPTRSAPPANETDEDDD